MYTCCALTYCSCSQHAQHVHTRRNLPDPLKKIISTAASVKTGFKDMYAEGELLMTLAPLKAAWPIVRAVQVSTGA